MIKTRIFYTLVMFIIAIIATVVACLLAIKFQFLENYMYNARFPINKEQNKQIIIVLIDDDTVAKRGTFPFRRSEYASVIKRILDGKPKVLGIDIFFDGIKDLRDDMEMIEILDAANSNIVLAVYPLEAENLIINKIKSSPSGVYAYENVSIGNIKAMDSIIAGITRISTIPFIDSNKKEYLSFPIVIASKYVGADYKQKPLLDKRGLVATLGDIEIPLEPSYMLVNYIGGYEAFDTVSFDKIAETDTLIFQNKIVLIGTSAKSIKDNFVTPISKDIPGVFIHANAIHTIINKRFIREVQFYCQIFIVFIICILISFVTFFIRPIKSSLIIISLLILSKVIIDFIFVKYRLYFLYSPLFFSVLLTYLASIIFIIKKKHSRKIGIRLVKT